MIIYGNQEGFIKGMKLGISHLPSQIISHTCLTRHKFLLFSSFSCSNRTHNVYCIVMGEVIINSWIIFFIIICWASGFISMFNWEQLVIRVWLFHGLDCHFRILNCSSLGQCSSEFWVLAVCKIAVKLMCSSVLFQIYNRLVICG